MSLLHFFKPVDGLPDPRGQLSSSLPSVAIVEANKEVLKAKKKGNEKRGAYNKYSAEVRAEIEKYAIHHGVAATSRHFSRRLAKTVSETTVRSIKAVYLEGVRRKRPVELDEEEEEIIALPLKKRGRPLLFIVNGFVRSGIAGVLDGQETDTDDR